MITTTATLLAKETSPSGLVSFLRFKVADTFDFQEGQFIMIDRLGVVDANGKSVKRAYSIGTTATEMEENNIV
jgi:ferredoxin-NADP reductase